VCLKDQRYAEEEDAQRQKVENMVLHPAILPDGGEGVTGLITTVTCVQCIGRFGEISAIMLPPSSRTCRLAVALG
jgi:hypothetical protein